jgi:hypothetical protein
MWGDIPCLTPGAKKQRGHFTAGDQGVRMSFSELNLKPEILKALDEMGYEDLTPIQEKTFEPILAGKDLLPERQVPADRSGHPAGSEDRFLDQGYSGLDPCSHP